MLSLGCFMQFHSGLLGDKLGSESASDNFRQTRATPRKGMMAKTHTNRQRPPPPPAPVVRSEAKAEAALSAGLLGPGSGSKAPGRSPAPPNRTP